MPHWEDVHPLKWAGCPRYLAVHPQKSFLYGYGRGQSLCWGCWIFWHVYGCAFWCVVHLAALDWWTFWLGAASPRGSSLLPRWIFCQCFECFCVTTKWFFSWSWNFLPALRRSFVTLVDVYIGVSSGTRMCCGYSWYWPETRSRPVVGKCNLKHLQWSQAGPTYHAYNSRAPH